MRKTVNYFFPPQTGYRGKPHDITEIDVQKLAKEAGDGAVGFFTTEYDDNGYIIKRSGNYFINAKKFDLEQLRKDYNGTNEQYDVIRQIERGSAEAAVLCRDDGVYNGKVWYGYKKEDVIIEI